MLNSLKLNPPPPQIQNRFYHDSPGIARNFKKQICSFSIVYLLKLFNNFLLYSLDRNWFPQQERSRWLYISENHNLPIYQIYDSAKNNNFFYYEWNLIYLIHSRNDRSNIVPTLGFEPRTPYTLGGCLTYCAIRHNRLGGTGVPN